MGEQASELSSLEVETLRVGLRILALRRLGDADAAEEAVQETLARTVAALREGRGPNEASLGAFAAGIARHVIADMRRAEKRAIALDSIHTPPADSAPDPLSALISATERESVRAAILRLSARDRDLLRLCFFEGLAPHEVAARMGEPDARIRKRKERALARVRRALLDVERHEDRPSATRMSESHPTDSRPARGP